MSGCVLVTGATGFLGTEVVRRFLEESECSVVALVRARDAEAARLRLARAWWDWPDLRAHVCGRVEVLAGDVSLPDLGLDSATYAGLVGRVTHVVHAAADLRLHAPLDALRAVNVQGTAHVVALARAAHRDHGLRRFSHVSTAYVAGRRTGPIAEADLSDARGFSSAYEESKYEAERLVRAAARELPVSIFRPAMVVGDSRTGAIKTFNTLYTPLRLYLTGRLRVFPVRAGLKVSLVPIDYVADALCRLTLDPRAEGLAFHLVAPHETLPAVGELLAGVREWAAERLGVRLARPLFLPVGEWVGRNRPPQAPPIPGGSGGAGSASALGALQALAPYFREHGEFGRDNTDRLLGPYPMRWRELLPPLLEYAAAKGFFHRSERTVHEQVLFRLGSLSRPVVVRDLAGGQVATRTGPEVRRDILRALGALRLLGIGRGDRVALVGLNSTRYLVLDTAIGLAGAVSVPLYPTSPPRDIADALAAAGARALFIGAPAVLQRLGEVGAEVPLVSFCSAGTPLPEGVVSWDEFLARGDGATQPLLPLVGPDDAATIRCTSGTTGQPKGGCFTHAQLRWLAETACALHPWRTRVTGVRCLSFLPMSHVVEGIVAAYAAFYAPAPVEVCYLEDFRQLPGALRRARPTFFFCVPRFYEKLWAAWRASLPGRLQAAIGRPLRPLARWVLLRSAGLDRCTQMVAGSAPSSPELLAGFRELGIEVHNAYGLTEAPLVTMNRVGANCLDSAGPPLPETEVRIAEDGEVLVRGPQVMAGILGSAEPPLHDGWLPTGDLGSLTPEGHLLLQGRKKEILVTSYGKNVHPGRIEAMLKEIPGVEEALLVGDGRPFCAAVLWVGQGALGTAALEAGIAAANGRLSHPEQVKRWAVLPNDLSIERGDLTPNLKLRRVEVTRRLAATIEGLYAGQSSDAGPTETQGTQGE